MKKPIIVMLSCILFISSCCKIEDEYLFCGVENSIEELPWIMDTVNTLHNRYNGEVAVYRLSYGKNNKQVFKINACIEIDGLSPCSIGSSFRWFNCTGNIVCKTKYAFCPIISDSLTHSKLIYKE